MIRNIGKRFLLILAFGFGLACNLTGADPTPLPPSPEETPLPLPTEPIGNLPTGEPGPKPLDPTPTLASGVTEDPVRTAVPTVDIDTQLEYRVIHVDENDILNVRSGPGVSNDIVADLRPGQIGVRVVGFGQDVNGSLWVPVNVGTVSGWVNSRFLTENIAGEDFCADPEPRKLLDLLDDAVENRDGNRLAEISILSRGLRFRRYWDSDGVRFEGQQINNAFNLSQSYFWGTADGSGEEIRGSFSNIIVPLLDQDLLPATETGCNEILAGGTAGIVQLPSRYEGANYYSLYRPGADGNDFDWGTWVVGIERWQENYFVSFLVHFEREI